MKKIKQIKKADLLLQVLALAGSVIYGIAAREFYFFFAYFAVGAVQVISFLAHLALGGAAGLTPARRRYGKFLLILAAVLIPCIVFLQFLLAVLYLVMIVLLFASPVIAVAYWMMCYRELKLLSNETK